VPNVTIKNLYNLDGEYPLDLVFTHRDFRDIKRIAGVRANEVMESINAGDLDVIVALCAIALRRAQKQFDIEQLWDAEAGNITLDLTGDEEEAEAPLVPENEPESAEDRNSSGSTTNGLTDVSQEIVSPHPSGIPEQAPT
jgi:hypothetical protein